LVLNDESQCSHCIFISDTIVAQRVLASIKKRRDYASGPTGTDAHVPA
jgi:hypothetical protein